MLLERLARGPAEGKATNFPVSSAQRRFWLTEQMFEGTGAYNMPSAVRLDGPLNRVALEQALAHLATQHAALRTVFIEADGQLIQRVLPSGRIPLSIHWAGSDAEARALLQEHAWRSFDLARGPLCRALLIERGAAEHWFQLVLHHIVGDAWSLGLLTEDLSRAYSAFARRTRPEEVSPGPSYTDYTLRQTVGKTDGTLTKHLAYWRDQLADPPILDLPSDLERPQHQEVTAGTLALSLPAPVSAGLKALAEGQCTSLFAVLMALFQLGLARQSGQRDLIVGTPTAGRGGGAWNRVVGCFVNTLPIRGRMHDDQLLSEFLTHISACLFEALEHQAAPFEDIIATLRLPKDTSRSPLLQVMLAMPNVPHRAVTETGLTLSSLEVEGAGTRFDIECHIHETSDGSLEGTLYYASAVHTRQAMARLRDIFLSLCATAPTALSQPIARLFEDHSEAFLQISGVSVFGVSRGLFSDFGFESGLSFVLSGIGVFGSGVGVFLGGDAGFVSAVKGVCRAGGYYVPLDPDYPSERLGFMVGDAGLRAIVTDAAGRARLAGLGLCGDIPVIVLGADGTVEDDAAGRCWPRAALPDAGSMTGDHPAYLCYTSGSTGQPKGVLVPVRAVERLVRGSVYAQLGPECRVAHLSSPSFDAATFEIWGAHLTGAALVVVPREVVSDPKALTGALRAGRVDVAFLTTAVFNRVAREAPEGLRGMRQVLFGGEACDPTAVARVRAAAPDVLLTNVYGPTEATTFSTFWPVPVDWTPGDAVPIGGPIQDTVVHVLDSMMRPVPRGARGELWIGGPGVALGYLGRAGLSAERFRPDPFSEVPGARLYRTGDLVRWRDDGMLAFLDRADGQFKLRGHRIEPGEVEAALRAHPQVRDAAVDLRGAGTEAAELVAWVVGSASRGALRAHLAERLPAVMRPGAIVQVAELALTVNGKLDRAALPAPTVADRASDAASEGLGTIGEGQALERIVADIWADVLKLPDVGLGDDFFARGGHSLLVTRVVARLRAVLGIEVPVRLLFDHPELAAFADALRARLRPDALRLPPLVPRAGTDPAPLSFAQARLWVMACLAPLNPVWNVTLALELEGPLDAAALSDALDDIRARHAVLRTRVAESGGVARQEVLPPGPVALERHDLRGTADQEAALLAVLTGLAERPFDLGSGEVLRGALAALPDGPDGMARHALSLSVHHISSDGWSLGVLMRELGAFYAARRGGVAADLPPLAVQYADYAVWQRAWLQGEARSALVGYWRRQLDGTPVLQLPLDRPRPAMPLHRGAALRCEIPAAAAARMAVLARAEGATLFMALLALYQGTLSCYSGQDDVVTGTPVAGRSHRETEDLIGFFVNMLALRGDLSGDPDLGTLIGRLRRVTLGAYAHQELPFEAIVEALAPDRDASHHPLFQVHFALQSAEMDLPPLEDLSVRPLAGAVTRTRFDLECHLWHEPDGAIRGSWIYDTALFDTDTVTMMQRHFLALLEHWSAHPGQRLSDALAATRPEVPDAGLPAQTENLPLQSSPAPGDSLPARILAQAALRPEAPALVDGALTLNYATLCARAERVARALRAQGVGAEAPVGLAARRGADLIVGLLGILMAGARYVPLDPTYPAARLAHMAQDAGLTALLSDGADPVPDAVWHALGGRPVLEIGALAVAQAPHDPAPLPGIAPDQLAYTLYTSGSTGQPKGVSVTHGNVLSLLDACAPGMAPGPQDRWCLFHAYAFDFSVWEIWGALAFGGTLVIVPYITSRDPQTFRQFLSAERITVLNQTPTAFYSLIGADREAETPLALRLVIFGGEALDLARLGPWWARHGGPDVGGPDLVNMYGITETTVHVTMQRLVPDQSGQGSPIGRPIASLSAHVLDAAMRPLPPGAPGELYVGGLGVARGYEGQPGLTAARFVPDPFAARPGSRLYRSGDRVRRRADGSLDYLGRIDRQIQLRGHRVELGEIEALLGETPSVLRLVLETRDGGAGGLVLVAWVQDVPERLTAPGGAGGAAPDPDGPDGRIAAWQRIYDSTYETSEVLLTAPASPDGGSGDPVPDTPAAEPGFDISGWTSSFTGEEIGAEAMREWRDETCARIRALLPPRPRILEIGCGTGMLLFQLAPDAACYQAMDLSGPVIARLRGQCAALGLDAVVELAVGSAHELDQPGLMPERPVDLVILNSVVQYFPSAGYLRAVLRAAARRLTPGGRIFLGDLRDLDRLPAFHAQVLRGRVPETTARITAAHQAETARAEETELVLAPAFFATRELLGSGRDWPARALWKCGQAETEMNLYRYDLVLGPDPKTAPEGAAGTPLEVLSAAQALAAADLSGAALTGLRGPRAVLTGLRDPRLVPQVRLADWLARSPAEAIASETLADASQDTGDVAAGVLLPETLIAAARQQGYDACAVPAKDRPEGYDLWLDRSGPAWPAVPPLALPAPGATSHNDPLRGARRQRIEAAMRATAEARLPEHMRPAHYVFLDTLPVSPSGKMLAQNLPGPDVAPDAPPGARPHRTIPPRTATELALWRAFTTVLRRADLCVTDSFFQAGGNSLSALQLVSEIRARTGQVLPLQAVFRLRSVEAMASEISAEHGASDNPRRGTLVDLQPEGAAHPWFLAPPLGGSPLCYLDLARTIPPGQPVYGLQVPGLWDGAPPCRRIEDMAAAYLADIRTRFGAIPLRLAGWSAGGLAAFEMARQARANGQEVEALLVIDAAPATAFDPKVFDTIGDDIDLAAGILRLVPPREATRPMRLRALQSAARATNSVPPGLDNEQFEGLIASITASQTAYATYNPATEDPWTGTLTLVLAQNNPMWKTINPITAWQKYATNIKTIKIPGNHNTLFVRENIPTTKALFMNEGQQG
jgi:amino acid adenylation domain-containing protein